MAKFVIAGYDECPYFARAELLGDTLTRNLPDFKVHKIIKTSTEWEPWLKDTCTEKGWQTRKSPLIWRELLDRGGKGVLIGGANEFQEYVNEYYGIESKLTSEDMKKISKENSKAKASIDAEAEEIKKLSNPLHVCITDASNDICYQLIASIASGEVFGQSTEIHLHLLDENPQNCEKLDGVKMEAQDLCDKLLRHITVTSDATEAFSDCSIIVMVDNLYKTVNETKQEWLKRNASLYIRYAQIINTVAKKNTKVMIAGYGAVNLCATMMIKHAPNIPRQNIVAMSRMVENYAKSVIGERLRLNTSNVLDLIVWGNINGERHLDLSQSKVRNYDGAIWGPPTFTLPAVEMIHDKKWIEGEYIETVNKKPEKVDQALNHPAAVSFASAVSSMLQHWWNGTPQDQLFSLGVCSDGWYGVPEGLVFSFPITMHPKGYWNVVQDIDISTEMKSSLLVAVQDIQDEIEALTDKPKQDIITERVDEATSTEVNETQTLPLETDEVKSEARAEVTAEVPAEGPAEVTSEVTTEVSEETTTQAEKKVFGLPEEDIEKMQQE